MKFIFNLYTLEKKKKIYKKLKKKNESEFDSTTMS